jgi:ADP-ribose pyrophosphatase
VSPVPPKRLGRTIKFTGRVFRVESDRVGLSNGRTVTLDIVRHRGSVVLIPQPSPQKIILVRQYRYAIGRWIWELPAGTLDPGESARKAARRECAEEIGLSPRRIEKLGEFYPTPGFCDEVMIFFRCSGLERPTRPAALDLDEQLEPRAFSIAQVRQLIKRRQVVDMKTVVGLTLLGRG